MTPLKFYTDAFFALHQPLAFVDKPFSLRCSPLNLRCYHADSFEENRFNSQFMSQICQLNQKKSQLNQELLRLKNDEAGQHKRQDP